MDTNNIYIAISHMKSKVNWENLTGNEWTFVGEGNDFKEEDTQKFINSYFSENELYFAIDRHNANTLQKTDASSYIKDNLTNNNITLCNKTFNRMIEFNRIGVAKHGSIST